MRSPALHPRGFALVEVTLVVLFVSILVSTLVATATTSAARDRSEQVRSRLAEASAALIGYAQSHGRLPCPADPALPSSHPLAGVAASHVSGDCRHGYGGALPWVTLGLEPVDPWGRRTTYRVIAEYANATNECDGRIDPEESICVQAAPTAARPAHGNALEVRNRGRSGPLPSNTEPIASSLAVVLVIHGENGSGAFDTAGMRVPPADASDEARNANLASVTYVVRERRPSGRRCADDVPGAPPCGFDDSLAWLSRAEVIRALARAGRLR